MAVPRITQWSAQNPPSADSAATSVVNPRRLSLALSPSILVASKKAPVTQSSSSASNAGQSSLRSLRSLLPFGPTKQIASSSSNNGVTSKSSFGSFSSVRRALSGERSPLGHAEGRDVECSEVPISSQEQRNSESSFIHRAWPDSQPLIKCTLYRPSL